MNLITITNRIKEKFLDYDIVSFMLWICIFLCVHHLPFSKSWHAVSYLSALDMLFNCDNFPCFVYQQFNLSFRVTSSLKGKDSFGTSSFPVTVLNQYHLEKCLCQTPPPIHRLVSRPPWYQGFCAMFIFEVSAEKESNQELFKYKIICWIEWVK